MNFILFDGNVRNQLLPFTYTKPVADLRVGIMTIREKWEFVLGSTTSTVTEEYLSDKWPMIELEENVMINASYLPSDNLADIIKNLSSKQVLLDGEEIIAFSVQEGQEVAFDTYESIDYTASDILRIEHTWDIFAKNGEAITRDFEMLTEDRDSEEIPAHVIAINKDQIFIEEGATVHYSHLNATDGPIYIGKDAEIMEGALIRGPFAICDHGAVKMGAKIYSGTTIGPHCKVGGEVNNSVLMGYSSKGHDGFLGNSVLGEWCNIGADSNNSNLKNNYAPVKLWDYETGRFANTGLQFCGLMMGDHSKCGINTMFNTGTMVGVATNIFGSGFPRNFVPSFSWGGASGFVTHKTNKAYETAKIAMARRDLELTEQDEAILNHVFEETKQYRRE
ncbi:UDP-N-acetylglucosamine diphosphorylase/glucosamine-1-phosphate N-acetyltransferase [Dokdonia sp. Hel_I_63]|uniref:GlmU family protein n=1 Tax=unclassified Dokdonia TaxID=2615033 RepID=UPI00020A6644|nr:MULTISPECIES: GlmU family protein [unclassified Dokdonia]AEE18425.1 sugar phosphate nucleotidyl transferase [Dokdonia sp. 4H-3-7-5]TVZ22344.1 UDP-N-acetylglucosamine diphosphorylase/glucosamine-1-phosphate N-acetyltransferase [Dokdonia sp. Hel_I_63]